MEPIAYRKRLRFEWNDPALLVALGLVLVSAILVLDLAATWQALAEWEFRVQRRIFYILLLLLIAGSLFRFVLPKYNSLHLDDRGLTYRCGGTHGVWLWHELSAFSLGRGWWGRRLVRFTVTKGGERRRLGPLALPRTKAWSKREIWGVYDAPLDEIAAKLNEFRERALNDKGATASA